MVLFQPLLGFLKDRQEFLQFYLLEILLFYMIFQALQALKRIGVNLTIVVVDNNGGGIFSFLPIADAEAVDFQKLFHTPHGLDIETIGSTLGVKSF